METCLQKLMQKMTLLDNECRLHTRIYSTDVQSLLSLMADVLKEIDQQLGKESHESKSEKTEHQD